MHDYPITTERLGVDPAVAATVEEDVLAVLPFPVPETLIASLHERFPKSKFTYLRTDSYWSPATNIPDSAYATTTVLITFHTLPTPLSLAPHLKFVHFLSAGIDHVSTKPIYTSSHLPLTSSNGIHGPQIGEYVFATLLTLTHKIPRLLSWQSQRHWGTHAGENGYGMVFDLVGCTLGVLGYGSIGRQVARIGKAMGMKVLAYTASPKPTPESRRDTGYIVPGTGDPDGTIPDAWYHGFDKPSRLAFLEQGIDVLVVSVPMTEQTRGFLGKEEMEVLGRPRPRTGKGAYLINIARGPIVETEPLVEGLKRGLDGSVEGGLAGAALDVTDPEPLGAESELWGLENCLITPHVSGVGDHYMDRSFEIMARNLVRLKEGKPLLNQVSRDRGY